jgi:hypothetical protein
MKLSKSLTKWLGPVMLPVALSLALLQPGCMFGGGGPSAVGQGQQYRSGDATFDQFFSELHELQVELAKAPADEKENRIALAKKLGLELEEEAAPAPAPAPEATQPTETAAVAPSMTDGLQQSALGAVPGLAQINQVKGQVESAKAQVDQIGALARAGSGSSSSPTPAPAAQKAGPRAPSASLLGRTIEEKAEALSLRLALDVDEKALEDNDVKTELRTLPQPLEGDGRKLAEAVHDTARSELGLYVRMQRAKKNLDKLHALSVALDANVDAVFRRGGMGKKSEVRKNLEDARALIKLMQGRADEVSARADEVVSKLLQAASDEIDPPVETEEPKTDAVAKTETAPATAPKQTKSASKPGSSDGAARPAPKPAAARPVADFEP